MNRTYPLFSCFLCLFFATLNAQIVKTVTTPFNGSGGVKVNDKGEIFVADFGSNLSMANGSMISKIRLDGSVNTFATGFVGASGNDFGANGFLYQSNIGSGVISIVTPLGFVGVYSRNHAGPVGVAVDTTTDDVYIAECGGNIITKIRASDQFVTLYSNSPLLSCPNGLTFDDNGNLYTCNFNNGNIIKIDTAGTASVLAALPGNNNGHLTFANGVLYVVDRGGNSIYEVTLSGNTTRIAGTGVRGNDDGLLLNATFSLPNGIDASPSGDTLYVNDKTDLNGNTLNPINLRMIILDSTRNSTPIDPLLASSTRLHQNVPNPFSSSTTIAFSLEKPGEVELSLYDTMGRKVKTMASGMFSTGDHSLTIQQDDLSAGSYFYRLESGHHVITRKMLMVD